MGENTATDTNTMSAAIRTPRRVRPPCWSRDSTGPLITPIPAGAKTTRPRPARPIATGGVSRRAPSRARVFSVFPELERGPLALRDDVGLHRLQARVVGGERLAARGILDAPISIGFRMGSFACSSSDGARPSQNWVALNIALSTVGLLRCGRWAGAATPSGTGLWSTKPRAGSWQVAHDTWSLIERRLSLNSLSPSATLSGVGAAAGGTASS